MLLNLVKLQQPDISKNHLYVTVTLESKYQFFIDGREKVGIKNLKAFIDHSQTTDDVYDDENLEDHNPTKKRRVLIVFLENMESNQTLSPIPTELFLRGRKRNI